MKTNYTLHDLPERERPRERLREMGVNSLSNYELLAIIIQRGTRNKNVLELSRELLSYFGTIAEMKKASLEELQQVDGVGFATACKIQAALKLGEKALSKWIKFGDEISNPTRVFELFRNSIGPKKKELFYILSLDTRKRLIRQHKISEGSLDSSIAHPREIFRSAIKSSASAIILVHNHPSGDPHPSEDDVQLTKRLVRAGRLIGIEVLDHVIVTETDFFNLRGHKRYRKIWEL